MRSAPVDRNGVNEDLVREHTVIARSVSDEAIHFFAQHMDCFASLAMTVKIGSG